MRNNTCHIVRDMPTPQNKMKAEQFNYKPYLYKQTFKATSLEGAQKLVNRRNKNNIKEAIYTDQYGTEHKLKV
jgi:hypothetical protein